MSDLLRPSVFAVSELVSSTYGSRKVSRTNPEDNHGIGVSTCWVDDLECYETALLAQGATVVVWRGSSCEDALQAHGEWVERAARIAKGEADSTVVSLGYPGVTKDAPVKVVPKQEPAE